MTNLSLSFQLYTSIFFFLVLLHWSMPEVQGWIPVEIWGNCVSVLNVNAFNILSNALPAEFLSAMDVEIRMCNLTQ